MTTHKGLDDTMSHTVTTGPKDLRRGLGGVAERVVRFAAVPHDGPMSQQPDHEFEVLEDDETVPPRPEEEVADAAPDAAGRT